MNKFQSERFLGLVFVNCSREQSFEKMKHSLLLLELMQRGLKAKKGKSNLKCLYCNYVNSEKEKLCMYICL